jgi:hypothetical protein
MRELTRDELLMLDDNGAQTLRWVDETMTVEERKKWNRMSRVERDVMAVEHYEKLREKQDEESKRLALTKVPKKKWMAPDTLTARIEGSTNDVDAILAAFREMAS